MLPSIKDVLNPAVYVALDRDREAVVVVIRGTGSVSDLITDFMFDLKPIFGSEGYYYKNGVCNAVGNGNGNGDAVA